MEHSKTLIYLQFNLQFIISMLTAAPQTHALLAAPPAAHPFSSSRRRQRSSVTQHACRAVARQQDSTARSEAEQPLAPLPMHRRLLSGAAAAALTAAIAFTPASQSLAADAAKVTCFQQIQCPLQGCGAWLSAVSSRVWRSGCLPVRSTGSERPSMLWRRTHMHAAAHCGHITVCVLQVGTCLLESCQLQLAECLADGNCLQDLICLNTCNGRPDESDCQVRRLRAGVSRTPRSRCCAPVGTALTEQLEATLVLRGAGVPPGNSGCCGCNNKRGSADGECPTAPDMQPASCNIPQIKCGDLYEDGAVQTFNACAVSDKKCVPQRVDEGVYPVRFVKVSTKDEFWKRCTLQAVCF